MRSRSTRFRAASTARTATVLTLGAAVAVGLVATAGAAGAATAGGTPKPATPSGMKVVATSGSGFTVALSPAAHGRTYRVYASTVKADLYLSAMGSYSGRRTFAVATKPRVAVSGLAYSTSPYYYRVEVSNGDRDSWSSVSNSGTYLQPATPSSVTVVSGAQGEPVLQWSAGSVSGYSVRQSTSSDFASNVTSYVSRGPSDQFTPSAVSTGATYYYRVRALNGNSASPFSPAVAATVRPRHQVLKVLTYNVRQANLPHDEAPWSKRLPGIVGLIKSASPDVMGIQEGGTDVQGRLRQVDTIASHLSGYSVANTDTTQSGTQERWTGSNIIYRRSSMTPILTGGQWALGQQRTAGYTAFRTAAGARLLVVSVHLISGSGSSADSQRKSETNILLGDTHAYAQKLGITSIVIVGDTNSFLGRWHTVDTPGNLMRAAGMSDAQLAAQHLTNAQYSSINNYQRTAPLMKGASDHVFSSAGIGVTSWGQLLHVRHGRFVGVIPSDHNPVWTNLVLPID